MRCSRYSSCGCDKLSEASRFYLARMQSSCLAVFVRRCLSYRARRFEFCAAFGILRMCRSTFVLRALRVLLGVRCSRFAPHALWCCVLCLRRVVLRFGVLRVALYVVWYHRSVLYVWRFAPHLASSLEISCEVVCASFDAIARIRVLRVSRVRSSLEAWLLHSRMCRFASFTERASHSVRCAPLNFKI